MDRLEQIERLRAKANVSYEEAKQAYEAANGDLLEAVIMLERQGKIKPPEGDGFYSSEKVKPEVVGGEEHRESKKDAFTDGLHRFRDFLVRLIHKGNNTLFVVSQRETTQFKLPMTVMVLLTLVAPWVVIPLLIIGLFFDYHYRIVSSEGRKSE
ncbi:MAG: DUF4342 domain-containing protein [Candidatus Wallacebacter cryptica]|jgi:hypothetical protein|nr:DUF4342 domain-containing protein [Bacillota bacterium]